MYKIGRKINLGKMPEIQEVTSLEPRNYVFKYGDREGFYLEEFDDFDVPSKMYGNPEKAIQRILKTFHDKDRNEGVIFNGVKGSGKTILAKKLAMESNLPVIILTQEFHGTEFLMALDNIKQECLILTDEFEKVFENTKGQGLLSLLDGIYSSKKLFVMTTNSTYINSNFLNRPSRVQYLLEFEYLDKEIIKEVIDDLLVEKQWEKSLIGVCSYIGAITYDILISLIDEVNRFNEDPAELVKMMNINLEEEDYTVEILVADKEGKPVTQKRVWDELAKLSKTVLDVRGNIDWDQNEDDIRRYRQIQHLSSPKHYKNGLLVHTSSKCRLFTSNYDYEYSYHNYFGGETKYTLAECKELSRDLDKTVLVTPKGTKIIVKNDLGDSSSEYHYDDHDYDWDIEG